MSPDELHDLVLLLKDGFASGEIKIPEGSRVRASLDNVRFGADGKVDPKTVTGCNIVPTSGSQVRLLRRGAMKSIPRSLREQAEGGAYSVPWCFHPPSL